MLFYDQIDEFSCSKAAALVHADPVIPPRNQERGRVRGTDSIGNSFVCLSSVGNGGKDFKIFSYVQYVCTIAP